MKLTAATRILDEEDIVEAFVRHTAHYCSAHLFLDNGSCDRTLEILSRLRDEGFAIQVFQSKSVVYCEEDFNTFLYRQACGLGGDWVLFLDVDEFIDDRGVAGGLLPNLAVLHRDPGLLSIAVPLVDYSATSTDRVEETNVVRRMVRRSGKSVNNKVIVRRVGDGRSIKVASGSHSIYRDGVEIADTVHPDLVYAHYSERSPYIWIRKFLKGWAKILASPPEIAERGHSSHYKGPYEAFIRDPSMILGDHWLMGFKNESDDLVTDPIDYRGGELRYFAPHDDQLHAVTSVLHYLNDLALQHSDLLSRSPEAMRISQRSNTTITPILGVEAAPLAASARARKPMRLSTRLVAGFASWKRSP